MPRLLAAWKRRSPVMTWYTFALSTYRTVIGWRMPTFSMDAASSHWAFVSKALRGWSGSRRIRDRSIRKAPLRRSRLARAPAWATVSSSSGSDCDGRYARRAAASAAAVDPFETALDFGEEGASDPGFFAASGMEGDGNAVGDTLLKLCQIGDHRVKSLVPEMFPQLPQIALLVGPRPLEAGDEIAEQLETRVVAAVDVLDGRSHLHDALGAPVGGFHRDDHRITCAESREAHEAQPRRTVEDEVVVLAAERGDGLDERQMQIGLLPGTLIGEVEAGELRAGRQNVDVGE